MWRWPYSPAEGVMLLLGLSLARSVSAQLTCQAAEAAQNLTQPQYNNTANKNTNADFLMPFILMYQVGFLVCIAIGILYIVLMPIIGFFVACCRCCGNCGGKMYQKQTSSIHCLRRTLYFSVFAITIIIFIDRIQANVTAVRDQINQTLSEPGCTGCQNLTKDVQKLTVDTTISAEEFFRTIPQRVTNETNDLVQNSIKQLNDIKAQISQVSSELHLSALNDVSRNLDQVKSDIDRYLPEVERADDIRWRLGVALCFVVLLVVACNILGLVLGPLGLSPKEDPTRRSCTSDCGGIFLMMGAGFSFLFSWLFMIVVLLLFLLGGNMYTLICRPWNNGLLLQFLDTPGLIPQLELGPALGLKTNINISDIYRDCEKNQPLWTTLHLHELVDLGDILNVSKYTARIREEFEKTNVTLSSVNLLSPEIKSQLVNFSAKTTNFNSTAVIQQMNAMSSINLNTTADKIEILSQQQPTAIKAELQNEALKLRQIQADIEVTVFPQVKNLNSSIKSLQSTTEKINGTVGEVLSKVAAAQDFLNTNTTQIVKTESRRFLDCQVDYFTSYADWATIMVTQEVGRCKPVARAVDSVEVVLCVNMVESLNAFWFSLGWCLMFFIPSIIFSIKLAKYYRRMKYSDCFDNHIVMNHIPRAQIKIT
ncbi:hypothetical protein GOODEAATRI_017119 [Goodea atripinnis]|uniref:Prominin 2 n=1 Tax=Goodea atripinnis TaxID=208336 RepID=A0ABV0PZG1_9TELE